MPLLPFNVDPSKLEGSSMVDMDGAVERSEAAVDLRDKARLGLWNDGAREDGLSFRIDFSESLVGATSTLERGGL